MTLPLSYSRPPIQEAHYLYFSKPAQHKCGGGRIRTCVDPKVDGFTARCHWPLDHPSITLRELASIVQLAKGIEPPTYGLQISCSTVELRQRKTFLPLLGKTAADEPLSLIDLSVGSTHHQLAQAVA